MTDAQPSTVEFFVPGRPATAGSKRAFPIKRKDGTIGAAVTDDTGAEGKAWRAAVASAALEAWAGRGLSDEALALTLRFVRPRPKGHYGTGRNAGQVRASASAWPTTRPDVLKLARAVEDALTGVIWRDDAQIVLETLHKQYGSPAGVWVTVTPMVARVATPATTGLLVDVEA